MRLQVIQEKPLVETHRTHVSKSLHIVEAKKICTEAPWEETSIQSLTDRFIQSSIVVDG